VEQLFQQLCGDPESLTVETTPLTQPISFRVSAQEARLFEELSGYFTSWGCVFNLARDAKTRHTVQITALPTLVAERCRMEPKLAIEMMRAELWSRHDDGRKIPSTQTQLATQETSRSLTAASETTSPSGKNWLNHIGNCPKGIIDLLNSRACRTAIMFNDVLSLDDCVALLSRLAQCAFPFQCAHGRPTMVPIVNVQSQDILEVPPPLSGICGRSGDRTYPSQSNRPVDFMEAFESWRSGHSEG
jgi:DNA mismatch repair protein MLH3